MRKTEKERNETELNVMMQVTDSLIQNRNLFKYWKTKAEGLERENEALKAKLQKVERERDAAIADIIDLKQYCPTAVDCYYCRKYPDNCSYNNSDKCDFEWRGLEDTTCETEAQHE